MQQLDRTVRTEMVAQAFKLARKMGAARSDRPREQMLEELKLAAVAKNRASGEAPSLPLWSPSLLTR
jgi:hypothetical protein